MSEPTPVAHVPRKRNFAFLKAFVLGLCYVLFVPVVTFLAVWSVAEYSPSLARSLIAPVLSKVLEVDAGSMREQAVQAARETALTVVEKKVSELNSRISDIDQKVSAAAAKPSEGQVNNASDAAASSYRSRTLLSALSCVSMARSEYLAGNRSLAQTELRSAAVFLKAASVPEDVNSMLVNAENALAKDSPQAHDWMRLLWHRLVDELSREEAPSGTSGT